MPALDANPAIAAYRARIEDVPALLGRLRQFEEDHACRIQPLRADRVHGPDHLLLAAHLAQCAVLGQRARSADLPTETLLYAAGERQVGKAIAFLGLQAGTAAVAALAWGEAPEAALEAWARAEGWERDDALLAGDDGVLDAFGVPAAARSMFALERRGDLVLEKVALLDVAKW